MQAANIEQLIHRKKKKRGGGERERVQPQMVRVAARGKRSHHALQGLSVNTGQAPKTDLLLAFVTGRGWGGGSPGDAHVWTYCRNGRTDGSAS